MISILPMTEKHWPQVSKIYQEGIDTGNATFEAEPPAWSCWNEAHMSDCRLIAVDGNEVLGWAALSPVSSRCVYAGIAEISVYVSNSSKRKGVGRKLLTALIKESEKAGVWTLNASVFPENEASIKLHESLGFRVIGIKEKVGKMTFGPLKNEWRDNVLLEKRSSFVGIN